MRYALLLIFTMVVFPLFAQEEGSGGGIYGYTSIEYDAPTNHVNAYSETDTDSNIDGVYHASVGIIVHDDHANYYA